MAAPRLEIRNLTRAFDGVRVVDGVSLSIAPGQVTCLLGPSGCGKSTVLRMIAGVDQQDSGEIHVDGKLVCDTVFRIPPEARQIGLMFQDFALFPHLDVAANVGFGLPGGGRGARAQIEALLEKVGMARHIDAYPHELSGGEQQRVALARALAPGPRVMLMDEPFSGLDDRLRDDIRDETMDLLKASGAAVLLVTHEPPEAMRIADEIALMRGGRIIQRGAPYNVYTRPADRQAAAFFSDINVLEGVVQGALVETAFGRFFAPGLADGTAVEIVFRPQHVHLDFDREGPPAASRERGLPARARVERARFMGTQSLIEFTLCKGGAPVRALMRSVFLPKPGSHLWLSVRREKCHVFPMAARAERSNLR